MTPLVKASLRWPKLLGHLKHRVWDRLRNRILSSEVEPSMRILLGLESLLSGLELWRTRIIYFLLAYILVHLVEILRHLDFSHHINRYGTLAVDPLTLDDVLLLKLHYCLHTVDVGVCHEAKPSRLLCPFIF